MAVLTVLDSGTLSSVTFAMWQRNLDTFSFECLSTLLAYLLTDPEDCQVIEYVMALNSFKRQQLLGCKEFTCPNSWHLKTPFPSISSPSPYQLHAGFGKSGTVVATLRMGKRRNLQGGLQSYSCPLHLRGSVFPLSHSQLTYKKYISTCFNCCPCRNRNMTQMNHLWLESGLTAW